MVTDARGYSTFNYYDGLGRLILQSDTEEYITATSYTAFGEVYQVTRVALRGTGTRTLTTQPTVEPERRRRHHHLRLRQDGPADLGHRRGRQHRKLRPRRVRRPATSSTTRRAASTAYYYDRLGRLVWDWVHAPVHRPDGSVQATGSHPQRLRLRQPRQHDGQDARPITKPSGATRAMSTTRPTG